MEEGFGRHVEGSADIDLVEDEIFVAVDSKSEVSDLPGAAKAHDVGGLEIPVYDIFSH